MSTISSGSDSDTEDGRREKPVLYVVLLVAVLLGAFVYELRTKDAFACLPGGSSANRYLAYCNSAAYNDYDHGAFWFDLEPGASRAAADADVLFLGSSRMQFAFSSDATRGWFAEHRDKFYLLGFSYSENVTFTAPLLEKLKPRASAYVINVDRFFETEETVPTADVFHGDAALSRYRRKRAWQGPHEVICRVAALCGDRLAFFRNASDGTWFFQGHEAVVPGDIRAASAPTAERIAQRIATAKSFVASLPAPRDCVLMTVAPSGATPWDEAEAIAAGVGVKLVAPRLEGLRTFDDSHLDPASAQLWSAAFLGLAGDALASCTSNREVPSGAGAPTGTAERQL